MEILSIETIKAIRVKNNDLWMEILKIALKSSPKETKKVLAKIGKKDKEICAELQKLSK